MTRFKRSAHYRTNSNGTTFIVREHDVARDQWVSPEPRPPRPPGPASAFSATYLYETGIIYPNARCPECRERCYFFKASNGGRVFFDTLWPDWDKHPCTISEKVQVMDAAPVADELEVKGVDTLEIDACVRPGGTVLTVTDRDSIAEFLSGDLDLTRKYFPHAWLDMDRESGSGTLTLLGADLKPVKMAVKSAEPPPPLTDRMRRELSSGMKQLLLRAARRIQGLDTTRSFLRTEPGYGTFILAAVGKSRVIIIPVPCDQRRWDWDSDDFDPIAKYMGSLARKIVDLLDKTAPPADPLAAQEHIIFAFQDPFGYIREGMGDQSHITSDGTLTPDAFAYKECRKLEERWLGNLRWIDLADNDPIVIDDVPVTIGKAFVVEENFCDANWPSGISGHWRQLEAMFGKLGLEASFRAVHRMLTEASFGLEHGQFEQQSAHYYQSGTGQSVRVLFHLSNAQDGICFLLNSEEEDQLVPDNLTWVRDAAEAVALVRRIKSS